jgi:saccharopine dehydrogenase-like NADP-dependent oxidoreductase
MAKHIILFGAGKSATHLIKYLSQECILNHWRLLVADSDLELARSKVQEAPFVQAIQVQVNDAEQRSLLVKESDLVISLLPPTLHFLVANDCLVYGKDLLTASYLDEQMKSMETSVKNSGLLFLCEMGLDPGIDHMSAMRLIHQIKQKGGKITSFKSHCGGLLAPESDDNPWHYKISWNPRNIVRAGSSGAMFKENNAITKVAYEQLFDNCKQVMIDKLNPLSYYPNRDSLEYMKLYQLQDALTFIRTTLRYPDYCAGWNVIVNAGLTNDITVVNNNELTIKQWAADLRFADALIFRKLFDYLGLFEAQPVPGNLKTSADILQYQLEKKLMMQPTDKDMIVMLHEIEFDLEGALHKTNSLLVLKGTDQINTAMAKTVGLPLGIAASLILKKKILVTGLHIPIIPEIYVPVLKELELQGIKFEEETSKMVDGN